LRVQAEAGAGSRGGCPALCAGAGRRHWPTLLTRAGGTLPTVAPTWADRARWRRAACGAVADHGESGAVRRIQRQSDPRGAAAAYIPRPSAEEILKQLLPLYVQNQMYRALVETAAAEHGARRTAMKNATDAGSDMLNILQRTFNRARQGQITQELAEIVGGAEALKG